MELTTTTHHDCAPYSAIQVRSIQKNSLFGASTGVCGCGSASCYFCIELLAPVSHPRSTTACVGSTGVPGRWEPTRRDDEATLPLEPVDLPTEPVARFPRARISLTPNGIVLSLRRLFLFFNGLDTSGERSFRHSAWLVRQEWARRSWLNLESIASQGRGPPLQSASR